MPRPKSAAPTPLLPTIVSPSPIPGLRNRDLVAIELARAYVLHHGRIAPDVVRDAIVASADELAKQLGWDD